MKFLKSSLIILLIPIFAFTTAHKFYVSVTNVTYSEKDASIQITSRIFIDDLEAVFKERYGVDLNLATDAEAEIANDYFEKYLRTKFIIELNGEKRDFEFLGKKYDNDIVICYFEVPEVDLDNITSIAIRNKVLTDLYDEQQNILHFKINGLKKSFVLLKQSNKGMLKL